MSLTTAQQSPLGQGSPGAWQHLGPALCPCAAPGSHFCDFFIEMDNDNSITFLVIQHVMLTAF